MARPKPPIYVLPHGIEVIGEYPPSGKNPYWFCRIRPHPFFPGVPVNRNGIYVKRSRVVMASHVGRALAQDEHVHHGEKGKEVDTIDNLTLMSRTDHLRHHTVGRLLDDAHKAKISEGMRRSIAEGRRAPPPHQDWTGRKHSEESKRKIGEAAKAAYAAGRPKPKPPNLKGRKLSQETKDKMRAGALRRWRGEAA